MSIVVPQTSLYSTLISLNTNVHPDYCVSRYPVNSVPGETMSNESKKVQPADMAALLSELKTQIDKIGKEATP